MLDCKGKLVSLEVAMPEHSTRHVLAWNFSLVGLPWTCIYVTIEFKNYVTEIVL
jgi:hypothetical protein